MSDEAQTIISWADKALAIASFFFPGVTILADLVKLGGLAEQGEPVVAAVIGDLHSQAANATAPATPAQTAAAQNLIAATSTWVQSRPGRG